MKKRTNTRVPTAKRSVDDVKSSDLVYFDGTPLNTERVKLMAKDPVLDWGFVFQNDQVVQGEFWLIVGRKSKFIYFHLTDELQPKAGLTEYGGYTVKIKSILTDQLYNLGRGSEVPVIGNTRDAFLVTTTKLMLNSKFCEGGRPRVFLNPQTRQPIEVQSLLHVVDLVQSYSIPYAQSASRSVGVQVFAPDGDLLQDELSATVSASASGSADCDEIGKSTGETVAGISASLISIQNYALNLSAEVLGSVIENPIGAVALTIAADVQEGINSGISNLATGVIRPLYAWLGETVCNMATGGAPNDTLMAHEIEFAELDVDRFQPVIVCDEYGDELVGSVASTDTSGDIEEVTVEGVTDQVCTEWHVEWVFE